MKNIKTGDKVTVSWGDIIIHGIAKKIKNNSIDVYMLDGINKNKTVNYESCYISKK